MMLIGRIVMCGIAYLIITTVSGCGETEAIVSDNYHKIILWIVLLNSYVLQVEKEKV